MGSRWFVKHPTVPLKSSVAILNTPFDNPDRIDIAKLTKMTRWMYATGRLAAEADKAPALDPTFKLERCRDFTGTYC